MGFWATSVQRYKRISGSKMGEVIIGFTSCLVLLLNWSVILNMYVFSVQ
jgi:hypothetical protein